MAAWYLKIVWKYIQDEKQNTSFCAFSLPQGQGNFAGESFHQLTCLNRRPEPFGPITSSFILCAIRSTGNTKAIIGVFNNVLRVNFLSGSRLKLCGNYQPVEKMRHGHEKKRKKSDTKRIFRQRVILNKINSTQLLKYRIFSLLFFQSFPHRLAWISQTGSCNV